MALGYNTLRAFPRLRTYEDAAAYEAKVKPIRGRTPEVKPLGRRSQAYYAIKREDNGDICIIAGDAPIVRYRPNGDVLLYDFGYWNKATYNDIIGEVTGIHTTTVDSKMWARVDGGLFLVRPNPMRRYYRGQLQAPLTTDPENIFRRVEKHADNPGYLVWTYVNPPGLIGHYIKRKEMRAVRQRYAAFIDYAKAMDSIRGDNKPEPKEYVEPFNVSFEAHDGRVYYAWHRAGMPPCIYGGEFMHEHAATLASWMLSDDATDNYKAYLWLNVKRGYYHNTDPGITDTIDRVLIMHHHAEVLTKREATAGKVTKDRYAWAVPVQARTA